MLDLAWGTCERLGAMYRDRNDYYRFSGWGGIVALVLVLGLISYGVFSYFR
jgi:hypothetical protein